jgi:hypothetical protein
MLNAKNNGRGKSPSLHLSVISGMIDKGIAFIGNDMHGIIADFC